MFWQDVAVTSKLPPSIIATLYPAGEPKHDGDEPTVALCLSGGGSRALTCALGQLSALRSLGLLDEFDHLSSVSGGSWASVAYTFLPETISDDDFLITPVAPSELTWGDESAADPGNVAHLDAHNLGTVPQRFDAEVIAQLLWRYFRWGMLGSPAKRRWFWIAAIGDIVLSPFGLWDAAFHRRNTFTEPASFFSESPQYVRDHILADNPDLDVDQFHTVRPGRTPLIVNMNLIEDDTRDITSQIPVQATPRETGALGRSPDGTINGGGSVESFGFASTYAKAVGDDRAELAIDRRFSLADIAGCSSAFYAAVIVQKLDEELETIENEIVKILGDTLHFHWLARKLKWLIRRKLKPLLDADAVDLIPTYDYWPSPVVSGPAPKTTALGISDGGDFENTGILGALARTDSNRILSMVNAGQGLTRDPATDEVILDGQLAVLFGYHGTPVDGVWTSFGGMSPNEPRSYTQVFSDDNGEFAALRNGLWAASSAGTSAAGVAPAAFRQTVTTVDNPVAHIRGGRTIDVLWVYNERVGEWQDQITDARITSELADGQDRSDGPFAHFPWYTTAGQIHLTKEAVNLLAQLTAWNVTQIEPMIRDLVSSGS